MNCRTRPQVKFVARTFSASVVDEHRKKDINDATNICHNELNGNFPQNVLAAR